MLALIVAIVEVPPASSATVLWVGGTGGSLAKLLPVNPFSTEADLRHGALPDEPISTIDYPSALWPITGLTDHSLGTSVHIGAERLVTAIKSTEGPLTVAGTSQGSLVVQQAQAALDDDPSVPSSTTFILIADPNYGLARNLAGGYIPILNFWPVSIPETRFNTIIMANQYDLIGDPITQPWNLLTDLNAVMGFVYVHPFAQNASLSSVPAENITTTMNTQGGRTTIYRVPTTQLPLTMPLRQLGIPQSIVDRIDAGLRPLIDQGYSDLHIRITPRQLSNDSQRKLTAPQRIKANRAVARQDGRRSTGTSHRAHRTRAE